MPSFIPQRVIRELRDLTRRRRRLIGNGSSEKNRVQKILEDASVKLGNVLADGSESRKNQRSSACPVSALDLHPALDATGVDEQTTFEHHFGHVRK
jgi:hypothetical protein